MRIEAAVVSGRCNERIAWGAGCRLGKIRVIESIEEAGSEFKSESLSESECSLQGEVPSFQPRCNQRVARTIPERPIRRLGKRARRSVGLCEITQLVVNRTNTIGACVEVADSALIAKGQERSSKAISEGGSSGDLPIARQIRQRVAGLRKWDGIDIGEYERPALIELGVSVTP